MPGGGPREPTYEDYAGCVPAENQWKLKEAIDFQNKGVDLHLAEIANVMVDWQLLAPQLRLTPVDVNDILSNNSRQPALQRYQFYDQVAQVPPNVENLKRVAIGLKKFFFYIDVGLNSQIGFPFLCRRGALQTWKSRLGFRATYGALLKICVDNKCQECAQKIVALLGAAGMHVIAVVTCYHGTV